MNWLRRLLFHLFYVIKPYFPRSLQLWCRRRIARMKQTRVGGIWPIDLAAAKKPPCFRGWPEGKHFALVLTHDVELQKGHDRVLRLMEIEQNFGLRSAFYFVPERYQVSAEIRQQLQGAGFEVGVHGLVHDGKLYRSHSIFSTRAQKINRYLKAWQSVGFRSPAMHHHLDWLHELDIEYDLSTFDTDPFEPQSDPARTIFPFLVPEPNGSSIFVEIPYTLPQDFSLFVIQGEKTIDIWKRKLDWLVLQQGVALVNTHPDYMHFPGQKRGREEYSLRFYLEFLEYVCSRYRGFFWNPLPKELAQFWKDQCLFEFDGREHCRTRRASN